MLSAGVTGTLAGCIGAREPASRPELTPQSQTPGGRLADVELPVPRSDLVPAIHSAIPAIVEPAFGPDWSGIAIENGEDTYEPRLQASTPVIGVERSGIARAYPLGILERHEVVNDRLPTEPEPEPLLVTYCPSCGSSMTALRRLQGQPVAFEVSHFLWRSNLVLRDGATDSLWSQLLAGAISGPATGTQLTLVPSTLETWGSWQDAHPGTQVLLPPPLSTPLYTTNEESYGYDRFTETAPLIGEDENGPDQGRTLVIGVATETAAVAYPFSVVQAAGLVNDTVGELPVVVATGPDGSLVAYDRRVQGEILQFRRTDDPSMRAGESRWLIDRGLAVDGPFEGVQLRLANDLPPLFRFAWADFHPRTRIYGGS